MKKTVFAACACLLTAGLTACGLSKPIETIENGVNETAVMTAESTTTELTEPETTTETTETRNTFLTVSVTTASSTTAASATAAPTTAAVTTTTAAATTLPVTTTTAAATTLVTTTPAPTAEQEGGEYDTTFNRYVKRVGIPASFWEKISNIKPTEEEIKQMVDDNQGILAAEIKDQSLIVTYTAEYYNTLKKNAVENITNKLTEMYRQGRYKTVTGFKADEKADNVTVTVTNQNAYLNSADGLALIEDISQYKHEAALMFGYEDKVTMHITDSTTGKEFIVKDLNVN